MICNIGHFIFILAMSDDWSYTNEYINHELRKIKLDESQTKFDYCKCKLIIEQAIRDAIRTDEKAEMKIEYDEKNIVTITHYVQYHTFEDYFFQAQKSVEQLKQEIEAEEEQTRMFQDPKYEIDPNEEIIHPRLRIIHDSELNKEAIDELIQRQQQEIRDNDNNNKKQRNPKGETSLRDGMISLIAITMFSKSTLIKLIFYLFYFLILFNFLIF